MNSQKASGALPANKANREIQSLTGAGAANKANSEIQNGVRILPDESRHSEVIRDAPDAKASATPAENAPAEIPAVTTEGVRTILVAILAAKAGPANIAAGRIPEQRVVPTGAMPVGLTGKIAEQGSGLRNIRDRALLRPQAAATRGSRSHLLKPACLCSGSFRPKRKPCLNSFPTSCSRCFRWTAGRFKLCLTIFASFPTN